MTLQELMQWAEKNEIPTDTEIYVWETDEYRNMEIVKLTVADHLAFSKIKKMLEIVT